jgi:hypothetical protein
LAIGCWRKKLLAEEAGGYWLLAFGEEKKRKKT